MNYSVVEFCYKVVNLRAVLDGYLFDIAGASKVGASVDYEFYPVGQVGRYYFGMRAANGKLETVAEVELFVYVRDELVTFVAVKII